MLCPRCPSITRLPILGLSAAIVAMGVGAAAFAQTTQVLRLATQDLPPYQMIEGNDMTGIAVNRVKCALDSMNVAYEFNMTNWADAQLGTRTGRFDGFFVGSSNSERAQYAVPSGAVVSEGLAWYLRPNSTIDPNNPADAMRARYSAKFATSKWRDLHNQGYNVVMRPRDAESLLNMLITGQIDAALEYELIFSEVLAKKGLAETDFIKIPFGDSRQDMQVHFSKQYLDANPVFLDRFNSQMTRCVEFVK